MRTLQRARTARSSRSRSGGAQVPLREVGGAEAARPEAADRETEPSSASGGTTTFTREPSGSRASHSGSASSTRRPSGRGSARSRGAGPTRRRSVRPSARCGRRARPRPAGTVDHHLVDAGSASSGSSGRARTALGDPRRKPRASIVVEQAGLAVDEVPDALVQVAVGVLGQPRRAAGRAARRELVQRRVAVDASMPHIGAAAEVRPPTRGSGETSRALPRREAAVAVSGGVTTARLRRAGDGAGQSGVALAAAAAGASALRAGGRVAGLARRAALSSSPARSFWRPSRMRPLIVRAGRRRASRSRRGSCRRSTPGRRPPLRPRQLGDERQHERAVGGGGSAPIAARSWPGPRRRPRPRPGAPRRGARRRSRGCARCSTARR